MKKFVKPLQVTSKIGELKLPADPAQMPDPKFAKVISAITAGDWDKAIRLAAIVTKYGKHAEAIQRGKDAILNPDIYRQLGRDPEKLRSEAITALKERLQPPGKNQEENP